jgi:hypothetical protein
MCAIYRAPSHTRNMTIKDSAPRNTIEKSLAEAVAAAESNIELCQNAVLAEGRILWH